MYPLKKVAIANRGEIAVRIISALKELGITSCLLHSSADQDSLAYRMADEALCIGSGSPKDSYLDIQAIIKGAKSSGASALHPGIGFLSESSDLALACLQEDIDFIGPEINQLKLFGNKVQAIQHVQELDIPTLPACFFNQQSEEVILEKIKKLSFPLMIKLAEGGGGIGLKKVNNSSDFLESLKSVRRIGQSTFGSNEVFVEHFIENARHIEVQIFGDHRGNIHLLGERDCSIQVRNQKIIEESPTSLSPKLLEPIRAAAQKIGYSCHYKQAGTVEFLVKDNQFYFLEMNTRLQVEHTVTEELLNVDLVQAQIRTTMEQDISLDAVPKGHSIECRIYSQNEQGFPLSGKLGSIRLPHKPGVRFDFGYESYDLIPSQYDSLIGKVIVKASNRAQAIQKMLSILDQVIIFGLPTNIPILKEILSNSKYQKNQLNLNFKTDCTLKPISLSVEDSDLIWKQIKNSEDLISKQQANPWLHEW